jgi:ribosomal protein L30E
MILKDNIFKGGLILMKKTLKKALAGVMATAIVTSSFSGVANAEIVKYYAKDSNDKVYEYQLADLVRSLNGSKKSIQ